MSFLEPNLAFKVVERAAVLCYHFDVASMAAFFCGP